jgi:hypothetical protein
LQENLCASAARLWPFGHGLLHSNHIARSKQQYAGAFQRPLTMKACMHFRTTAATVTGAGLAGAACLVATIAGCSSPTHPGVSVASGRPVSPASGMQFSYYNQPITLVVANGVATGSASPVTTVEVASDAAFTTVITTQAVSLGANGQPIITLDHLAPATTYYWRVKNDGRR